MPEPRPTVRSQRLGKELRFYRETTGMTLADAGKRINSSASTLSRVETGHREASVEDVAALLAVYQIHGDDREHVLTLAREVERTGWWQRGADYSRQRQPTLIALESHAHHIVTWESSVVPELLQTEEYSQAVTTDRTLLDSETHDSRVRKRVLRRPRPPTLLAIIDELVLHRVVGGTDVLRRQLRQLITFSSEPHIRIRVLPNTGDTVFRGAFELIDLIHGAKVAFFENLASALFLEETHETDVFQYAVQELSSRALNEQDSAAFLRYLAAGTRSCFSCVRSYTE